MTRQILAIIALLLANACVPSRPPRPPAPTFDVTIRVFDAATGAALAPATITIDGQTKASDALGGARFFGVRGTRAEACAEMAGYIRTCGVADRSTAEFHLRLAPIAPPTPPAPVRVSGAALLDVRGNFCNLFDSQGRIVYTPALPGAPDDVYAEWMQLQRDAGSTHVFFGPPIGGAAYPGISWSNPDFWADLPAFRAFVERVLSTPAADGQGFRPVIFVGGDTFAASQFDRWGQLATALDGLHEHLIVVPAWEPVVGGWTSLELSRGLVRLAQLFPTAQLGWHGSPTRWVGSSHPVEADDPWQGGESEFYRTNGGQFISVAFYQTPHGLELWRDCNEDAVGDEGDRCFLNRWQDGVMRLGAGINGWRRLRVVLYETVAFEAFRHQATSRQARETATLGQRICRKWNVECGYGNGLPWDFGFPR